eukprot:scaffold144231_cov18-Tisochrysis_lutea.AAC.1
MSLDTHGAIFDLQWCFPFTQPQRTLTHRYLQQKVASLALDRQAHLQKLTYKSANRNNEV